MSSKNFLFQTLEEYDSEIHNLILEELDRQSYGLELIASENFTSLAVLEANGSILTNKYSEGLPGKRYYGGNECVDKIENVCIKRALAAFNLDPEIWGVNVQPYSGSPANFEVYTGILSPGDKIMGLDLPAGGHLTHGYQTPTKKISASSIYFDSKPYTLDPETCLIDYQGLKESAKEFQPKLIISGASAYPREWDWKAIREAADGCGALMMADVAHISALIMVGVTNDPFKYADIVTTTTHKTMRGPRAAMIFFRKKTISGEKTGFEDKINQAVFPGCQGGPHNQTIAAIAVALKQCKEPEFQQYCKDVVENCKALANGIVKRGGTLVTGGTDNHLILWNLKPLGVTGSKYELLCEKVAISINKNTVLGDKSASSPGGVRIGTAAITSRGADVEFMKRVVDILFEVVDLAKEIQNSSKSKLLKDFIVAMNSSEKVDILKSKVIELSKKLAPVPRIK